MSDNTITIAGNATRDPELRFTDAGRPVATFAVAVTKRYQTNGDWQERTSFIDVVVWGELGQNTANTVRKGQRVLVTGEIEQRSWESDDGDKRTKHELVATDVGPSLRWAQATVTKVTRDKAEPEPAPAA